MHQHLFLLLKKKKKKNLLGVVVVVVVLQEGSHGIAATVCSTKSKHPHHHRVPGAALW
jgi:hypothetical protein